MKKEKQAKRIEMFHRVNQLMESNLEKWKSTKEIRKTYDEFVSHLKKFKDLKPDVEMDLTPLEKEWEQKRKYLVSKAFPIGNILLVYAEDHSKKRDPALGISWDRMNGMKNKDLLRTIRRIYSKAVKYAKTDLESYGMTEAMINELGESLNQCEHIFRMRSDMRTNQKNARKKSRKHYRALRSLLRKRLDKLMSVFSGTHPSFYQEYLEARKIR